MKYGFGFIFKVIRKNIFYRDYVQIDWHYFLLQNVLSKLMFDV